MENSEFIFKLWQLQEKFKQVKTNSEKYYIIRRLIDLTEVLIDAGFDQNQLSRIRVRLLNTYNYGRAYDYSLAENLKEQKIIIADSIQSSPMHLKKIELQNTAIINYPEQQG